jgi:hypothetical protein
MAITETGDARLTATEVDKLNADLAIKLRARVPSDARVAPKPPAEAPGSKPGGSRRPLGLAPVGGSSEPVADEPAFVSGVPSVAAGLSEATRQRAASMADVAEALDAAIAINCDGESALRARIVGLETENARDRATIAELRSKLAELDFVVERLRVENRGPPGVKGERGRDGRDGPQGIRGERGERGEMGKPAAAIIEWRPDPEAFTIQAILSDGTMGPMIALRSLFEAYHNAVSWIEDADLVEAARQSRARNEQEAEARHWAR